MKCVSLTVWVRACVLLCALQAHVSRTVYVWASLCAGVTYCDVLLSDGHRSLQLCLDDLDELGSPVLGAHAAETRLLNELWRQVGHSVTQ